MKDEMKELDALLDYLIGHNKDHAGEITALAEKALTLGKSSVHDNLMRGVEALNTSNESLIRALEGLRGE
jgi:hypothetical protein